MKCLAGRSKSRVILSKSVRYSSLTDCVIELSKLCVNAVLYICTIYRNRHFLMSLFARLHNFVCQTKSPLSDK